MINLVDSAGQFIIETGTGGDMPTKRCCSLAKHGCEKRLPITEFQTRKRERRDGSFRLEHAHRCKQCQRLFEGRKRKSRAKERIIPKFMGWQSPETKLFLCGMR